MNYTIKNVPIHTIASAPERSKPILESAGKSLGFVPNMYAAMANNPALLESYVNAYAAFRAHSSLSPIEQEVVLLAISRENECEYCMAAHSVLADMVSKVPAQVTDALRDGLPIADRRLQALARFSQVMVATRGRPDASEAAMFLSAGYSDANMLDIVLAIGVKTLSNYANHLLDTPVDVAFATRSWHAAA